MLSKKTYWGDDEHGNMVRVRRDYGNNVKERQCDICEARTIEVVARIKGKTICEVCADKASKQIARKDCARFWAVMARENKRKRERADHG